jgi:CelD/BcsL family acetyltransferase involved in cellulose biosynthesis
LEHAVLEAAFYQRLTSRVASLAPLELLPAWALPEAIPGSVQMAIVERDWRAFDTAAEIARWDALAEWASEPNPFHESWFLLPALRAHDPAGTVSLVCLEAGGQLAGLMPVRRDARYYGHPIPHWSNWLHGNAFAGAPLVAKGFERAFWRELFTWADREPRGALFLHLSQLPAGTRLSDALAHVLDEQGRASAVVMREERALLRSNLDPEAYLEASLSGKKRKELRRQHRRLAEEGELTVERTATGDGLGGWIREFLALEQGGWKGEQGSALGCDPATARLFAEALAGAAGRGRLERLAIRLDGKPLAMLATFLTPPGAFSFKTAFDEAFARFSPGVLLQCEALEMLNRPEIAWTDSCAAADHPMIDHFWRERRTVARHNIAIGGKARRLLFRAIAARETGSVARGSE